MKWWMRIARRYREGYVTLIFARRQRYRTGCWSYNK